VLTAAWLAWAPAAGASPPAWTLQATANPAGLSANILGSVSCPAAGPCMAVGYHMTPNYGFVALAERWNGRTWALTTMDPTLTSTASTLVAVSCPSATACTAVGFYYPGDGLPAPVVERWNGTAWTGQAVPTVPCRIIIGQGCAGPPPSISLDGVSCATTEACTAVGDVETGTDTTADVALLGNGSTWTVQPTPTPPAGSSTSLNAVSCPSVKDCVAVGQEELAGANAGWADHWNGSTWTGVVVPLPGGDLTGVSCSSAEACTAVGYLVATAGAATGVAVPVAERGNGVTWTEQGVPRPPSTLPVTGAAPAGSAGNLSPDIVKPPVVGGHGPLPSQLNAVSCPTATSCTAVGSFGTITGGQLTLAESWNGKAWVVDETPDPAGATMSSLLGLSCTATSGCEAVGSWDSYIWSTQGFYPISTLGLGES
jgi:hypothetical protein